MDARTNYKNVIKVSAKSAIKATLGAKKTSTFAKKLALLIMPSMVSAAPDQDREESRGTPNVVHATAPEVVPAAAGELDAAAQAESDAIAAAFVKVFNVSSIEDLETLSEEELQERLDKREEADLFKFLKDLDASSQDQDRVTQFNALAAAFVKIFNVSSMAELEALEALSEEALKERLAEREEADLLKVLEALSQDRDPNSAFYRFTQFIPTIEGINIDLLYSIILIVYESFKKHRKEGTGEVPHPEVKSRIEGVKEGMTDLELFEIFVKNYTTPAESRASSSQTITKLEEGQIPSGSDEQEKSEKDWLLL